ncbi:MAG: ribonuclease T2 family protein, partial [Rhodanobacteraceae bacterium]
MPSRDIGGLPGDNQVRMRGSTILFAGVVLAAIGIAAARGGGKSKSASGKVATGQYDYYVMALSWSPTYCQTHEDEEEQCGHKGYGFILHGLWPQYESGGGPEQCSSEDEPDRKTIANALAFMPSRRLINHEWRAHGACTGLGPAGYFGLADRAFAAVRIPPALTAPEKPVQMDANQLVAAFRSANPGLDEDMLSLHCSRGDLVEVRICLDKDLNPRDCGKRMQSRCPT